MEGLHLLVDAKNCCRGNEILEDPFLIQIFMEELCSSIKMKMLTPKPIVYELKADPYAGHLETGYTCITPLKESHASLHTFKEVNGFSLDIFSCKIFDIDTLMSFIFDSFGKRNEGTTYNIQIINRSL